MNNIIPLPDRSVIKLYGPDIYNFLQKIITTNMEKLHKQKSIYSLLLTPKGRYLYDFFLIRENNYIFLECNNEDKDGILEKLSLYKLQAKIKIFDVSQEYNVYITLDNMPESDNNLVEIIFRDPRKKELGTRIITKNNIHSNLNSNTEYEILRIKNLVPNCFKEMLKNISFPLHYNIDKLNGIDFDKGCYIGQEVTARMSRSIIKKKLAAFYNTLNNLEQSSLYVIANKQELGRVLSITRNVALCLINTELFDKIIKEKQIISIGNNRVFPYNE